MHTLSLLIASLLAQASALTEAARTPSSMGWLAGEWCSDSGGEFVEEHWLRPRGDAMFGLSRTVRAGKTVTFEYLRIEQVAGVTTYLAQPQGAPPIAFRLTESGDKWARFENPTHDFPRRVEYRRSATGLHAEIAGPGSTGKELVIPFEYHACSN